MKKILILSVLFIFVCMPLIAADSLSTMIGRPTSLVQELYNTQAAGDESIVFTDKEWFGALATTQLLSKNGIVDSIKIAFDSKSNRNLLMKNITEELGENDTYNQPTEGETNSRYYYKFGLLWTLIMDDNSAAMLINKSEFADSEIYQVPKDSILIQTSYGDVNGNKTLDRVLLVGKPDEIGYSKLYVFAQDGETRDIIQGTFNYKLDGGTNPELKVMDINGDGISDIFVKSILNDGSLAIHAGTFAGGEGYQYLVDPMELHKGYTPIVRLAGNYNAYVVSPDKKLHAYSLENYKETLTSLGIYSDEGKFTKAAKVSVSLCKTAELTKPEDSETAIIKTTQDVYIFDTINHICTVETEYSWKRDAAGFTKTINITD